MIKGKEYEVNEWNKSYLIKLAEKALKEVQLEMSNIRIEEAPLEYSKRIMELMKEESDLKYSLDQLSGIPML